MNSVKKGLKNHIKDKFYGFKVGQGLEKPKIQVKFEIAAMKVYERALVYLYKNSPFKTFKCLS
jgi:hypothetical protein